MDPLPRLTLAQVRALPCPVFAPPYQRTRPSTALHEGKRMVPVADVNRNLNDQSTGQIGGMTWIDSKGMTGELSGHTQLQSFFDITVPRLYLGYTSRSLRARLTLRLTFQEFWVNAMRRTQFPPPHSSSIDYLAELHALLPATGEIVKFRLGQRSFSGGQSQGLHHSEMEAPGTAKVLTALTQSAFAFNVPITLAVGTYIDHWGRCHNMSLFSKSALALRIDSVSLCPVI